MNIQDLYLNKDIDPFTLHVCKQNNLLDLESILDYYKIYNKFLGLEYCNKEVDEKLKLVCSKYGSLSVFPEHITNPPQEIIFKEKKCIPNYTLEQLAEIEDLRIRTQNACKYFNLDTLREIIYYYKNNGDFLKVRNCGRKSNDELIKICKKYEEFFIDKPIAKIDKKNQNSVIAKIENLKASQKKIVDNLIISSFNNLSVRSSNALRIYLDGEINLKGFKSIFADQNFRLANLRNVGKESTKEIQALLNTIEERFELITGFDNNDELRTELFNSFITKTFEVPLTILSQIGNEYNFSNKFPIFKTLNVLIDANFLFDAKEKKVFKKGFKYYNSNNIWSLKEMSKNLNLSLERVRQIRKFIYDNLNSTFSFIKVLENDSINFYGIDINSDIIIIGDEIISEINTKEKNSFNLLFVNKILSIILDESFTLIGNEENTVTQKTIRTAHNWKSTYLIKKEIADSFDFKSFINDVSKRLGNRIKKNYSFHFETYILDFIIGNSETKLKNIIPVCEHLLFNEFKISLDNYNTIIFKRNTKKQVIEYVLDILKEKKEPLTVYEIYDILSTKYPNVTRSAEALRSSCQRNANLIYFGRSSTYGLKIWEKEYNLKGGTIRDITEEFLSKHNIPKHIDEITEYVNRYRDTTAKNIYSNLKMETTHRFVFFSGHLIGLKSKKYTKRKYIKIRDKQVVRKTWEEDFQLLKEFALKNNRLPFSTGNRSEKRLYHFLNVQLNRARKGKIEESESNKVKHLCDKYGRKKGKKRYSKSTNDSYSELKEFLLNERRQPSATKETKLYHFLYAQKKQYKNNTLPKKNHNNFLEVKNLINKIQ